MAEQNPEAELMPRSGDIRLSPKQYGKLSLFAQLKRVPTLEKFPGAMVVRHYKPGDITVYQGEAGWTAFYILTLDDVLLVLQAQLAAAPREKDKAELRQRIEALQQEKRKRQGVPPEHQARQVVTVQMAALKSGYSGKAVQRMLNFGRPLSTPIVSRDGETFFPPVGGPQTISYETGKVPLFEGDLFGEMSCLYRTPRSATVRSDRDWYMIEFLRHILDSVHRDAGFKARADAIYRKRALELQVRKMPLFRGLSNEEFKELEKDLELVEFEGGEIICDEHDRSDCMYLVRNGLVRVMTNVSHLLGAADLTDWVGFCEALRKGAATPTTAPGRLWALLPERTRTILQGAADLARLGPADRFEVIFGVNDVLKNRKTADDPEIKKAADGEPIKVLLRTFPGERKKWSDNQVRQFNRRLLEALLPGVREYARHAGVETILAYCSPDHYFGEMGLMLNQPRSATCMAYGHPNQQGGVQLVKITSKAFWRLTRLSSSVREQVRLEIAKRRDDRRRKLLEPPWAETNQVQFSEEFGKLGLIQGQKLMLIDLDRCTRCDECVKACVKAHGGTQTRLFLDGPRFDKYLVPTTCRSCLDPVCMIRCPVASIHRGDNKQIVIEDWCIGCESCAKDCPYGSIQMQDLGIIADGSRHWRFLPAAAAAPSEWFNLDCRDDKWPVGIAPFVWERDFQTALQELTPRGTAPATAAIHFRHAFELGSGQLRAESRFLFEVLSAGSDAASVRVWLNGSELARDGTPKRGRHEYPVPPGVKKPEKPVAGKEAAAAPAPAPATDYLRFGRNVVAVQVLPRAALREVVFQLRLDEIKKPKARPKEVEETLDANVTEEISEKLVTLRAVVCDLCSELPSKLPACVHACPHDAAMRVDARTQFPTR